MGALWGRRLGPWSQSLWKVSAGEILNLTQPLAGNLWLDSSMSAEPEPTSLWFPGSRSLCTRRKPKRTVLALSARTTSGLHIEDFTRVRNTAPHSSPKVAKTGIMSAKDLLTRAPWPPPSKSENRLAPHPHSEKVWFSEFSPRPLFFSHLPSGAPSLSSVHSSLSGLQFPQL